jgi:predicted transposase/invertase (TIGR01784 family)
MITNHDSWYKELFSDHRVVEDLLTSFVKEEFVRDLDFSSLKKLNSSFISPEFKNREADVFYEIKSRGQSTYIYLLIEFQSTVDRFMALRMGSYVFQFHQEVQRLSPSRYLQPVFPILIYNGDDPWTAPESFRSLLVKSTLPKKYLPEFRYYKIAINEIPKRELVRIRNAVSAVFYIENSSVEDIAQSRQELVEILKAVFAREGAYIINSIVQWMQTIQKIPKSAKIIKTIKDITEVVTMFETRTKKYEERVFKAGIEKGIEQGIEKGIEKGIEQGMLAEKHHVLIDLMSIKFGGSVKYERIIKSVKNVGKLENAIRKILSAQSGSEVMKCLG